MDNRRPSSSSTPHLSSAFSSSAHADEDWTQISDLAERRRIQNRIAQRNYRKKLKKRLGNPEGSTAPTEPGCKSRPSNPPSAKKVKSSRRPSSRRRSSPQHHAHTTPPPLQDLDVVDESISFAKVNSSPTRLHVPPQLPIFGLAQFDLHQPPSPPQPFGLFDDHLVALSPRPQTFFDMTPAGFGVLPEQSCVSNFDYLPQIDGHDDQFSFSKFQTLPPEGMSSLLQPDFLSSSPFDLLQSAYTDTSLTPDLCDMHESSSAGSPGDIGECPLTPNMLPMTLPFTSLSQPFNQ